MLLLRAVLIEVLTDPEPYDCVEGVVARMARIGFEVRVGVEVPGSPDVAAVLSRPHVRALGPEQGSRVWLKHTSDSEAARAEQPSPAVA